MQALGVPPAELPPAEHYPTGYPAGHGQPQYGPGQPPGQPGGYPGGPRPGGRSKALDYTLKGLGLLGVAVVSGFLWWLFRHGPATPSQTTQNTAQNTGVYQFTPYHDQVVQTDCANHATAMVQAYLKQHPCTQLTRSLYTTSLDDGDRVITSVAVVQMSDAGQATGLKHESDGDGTGHVQDLVEDHTISVPGGPPSLEEGGYMSAARGDRVIIVETEFVEKSKDTKTNLKQSNAMLVAVSQDALRLGEK